jgi:uncharacterized membrane protein
METIRAVVPLAFLFIVCDAPWLYATSGAAEKMIKRIQGGAPLAVRWTGVPVVYLALGYLVLQATSTAQAFMMGLCTYAVYDFTNYSTLANYELQFAIADSLWGGVLFSIVREVGLRLNLL